MNKTLPLMDSGLRNYLRRVPQNSVLYMPGLDYGSWHTNTIRDYSGQANHGTKVGAIPTMLPSGLWGLRFDKLDDVINCGSASVLDNLAAITLIAWINPTSTGEGGVGVLFDKCSSVNIGGWTFVTVDTKRLAFLCDTDNVSVARYAANNSFTLSNNLMVVATWNGSLTATNIKFYVNGIETAYDLTTNGTGTRVDDSDQSLRIGNEVSTARTFDGTIWLPRIIPSVLTVTQILAIFNQERQFFRV